MAIESSSRRRGWRRRILATCAAIGTSVPAGALCGTVKQVTNFGNNPTNIGMYVYTPSNLAARPPILVGVHACHGKGTDVCQNGSPFAQQAEKFGFLLICPSAASSDGCWDVHSTKVLSHNGGGDASGIISMVNYAVQSLNGDASRVYVAGHSSGGMMTNVLLGSYPDIFKAGAAYAGVPFACFAQGSVDSYGWNSSCATGKVTKTGPQWGDLVRAAYSGFTGTRPRVQLWHGTVDTVVDFANLGEEIKEWTNVLGVSATPATTEKNALQSGWIRTRYPDGSGLVQVEAIQETGQPHNLVVNIAEAIHFFGLDGSNPVPDGGARDAAVDARDASGGTPGTDGRVDGGGGAISQGGSAGAAGGSGGAASQGGTAGGGGVSGYGGRGGAGGSAAILDASSPGGARDGGGPQAERDGSSGGTGSGGQGGSSGGAGSGDASATVGGNSGSDGGAGSSSSGRATAAPGQPADGRSGCSCQIGRKAAPGWFSLIAALPFLRRLRRRHSRRNPQ